MFGKPFIYLLIIGLIISASMQKFTTKQPIADKTADNKQTIDYYAHNFLLSSFNEQGVMRHQITGQELTHTDGSPSIMTVSQPKTRILAGQWSNWSMQAKQAQYSDQDEQWNFSGRVTIEKNNDDALPIAINTQQLIYEPKSHTLNTSAHVRITHPYGHTESIGMKIDLSTDQIQLTSKVTSRYQKNEEH